MFTLNNWSNYAVEFISWRVETSRNSPIKEADIFPVLDYWGIERNKLTGWAYDLDSLSLQV